MNQIRRGATFADVSHQVLGGRGEDDVDVRKLRIGADIFRRRRNQLDAELGAGAILEAGAGLEVRRI